MNRLGRLILLPVLCGSVSLMATPEELNQIDKWGWTPLMWATLRQYVPIVKFLLEKGADPNIAAQKADVVIKAGATPIVICGYYGTPEIAKLLLAAKADPTKADNAGEMAMSYAKRYEFKEMVELLSKASK